MISEQTLSFLVSKFDERREEIQDFIGQGALKDYSEYQKLCGFIQGLEFTKQLIADLAERMETGDDE
jgi:hypothetical protein